MFYEHYPVKKKEKKPDTTLEKKNLKPNPQNKLVLLNFIWKWVAEFANHCTAYFDVKSE